MAKSLWRNRHTRDPAPGGSTSPRACLDTGLFYDAIVHFRGGKEDVVKRIQMIDSKSIKKRIVLPSMILPPRAYRESSLSRAGKDQLALLIRERPEAKRWMDRKEKKYGKGKALSLLAAKLGRAVYWMLRRKEVFDVEKFFQN